MHVDPYRILIVASRHFAQIELNRVERFVNVVLVAELFKTLWTKPMQSLSLNH